jgi:hypothetical protein
MAESAFAVLVPESEAYVSELRARYDPSAALGAAAHITILYPFMPPEMISGEVLASVRAELSPRRSFSFTLRRIERFPGVLYLEPDPAQPLIALTNGLASLFPSYQPYGGRHPDVKPHLTVAQGAEEQLDRAENELRAILPAEGVSSRCSELVLIENSTGRWRQMGKFTLGGAHL